MNDGYPLFLAELPDTIGYAGPYVGTSHGALIVAGGANFSDKPLLEGGNKIWHDNVYVLTPGAKAWNTTFGLERPLAYGGSATTSKGVVLVGGSDSQQVYDSVTLLRWDPERQQLISSRLPRLPIATAKCRAAAIGDKVYVVAGKTSKDETTTVKRMWTLDLGQPASEQAWRELTPWPGLPRANPVLAVQQYDGRPCLFLFSGVHTTYDNEGEVQRNFLTDAYRYDPASDRWTALAPLPVLNELRDIPNQQRFAGQRWPVTAGCAIEAEDTKVMIFGGTTGRYIHLEDGTLCPLQDRPLNSRRVLAYDVADDAWSEIGHTEIGVLVTQAVRWNDLIVIPSGEVKPGIRTPKVQAISLGQE